METWDTPKAEIRKTMRRLLKALSPEEKSLLDRDLCERVLSLPEIREADRVYGYMALSWEAGTEEILKALLSAGKRVALPRVEKESPELKDREPRMDFFEICSLDDLKEGAFHILEPGAHCPLADWRNALVLVPGMAFTKDGIRLGKGGGYYDCFLEREPGHKTLALAYDFQMAGELPAENHDRPVDLVVTPAAEYRSGRP